MAKVSLEALLIHEVHRTQAACPFPKQTNKILTPNMRSCTNYSDKNKLNEQKKLCDLKIKPIRRLERSFKE